MRFPSSAGGKKARQQDASSQSEAEPPKKVVSPFAGPWAAPHSNALAERGQLAEKELVAIWIKVKVSEKT